MLGRVLMLLCLLMVKIIEIIKCLILKYFTWIGQTGSGKSYSVVGYGANKGIVPMFCQEIFTKIQTDKQEGTTYEVTFSMLEIYSEVVRDLLIKGANQKNGLTIREDPKNGFYRKFLRLKRIIF